MHTLCPTMEMIHIQSNLRSYKHLCPTIILLLLILLFDQPFIVQTKTADFSFSFDKFSPDMSEIKFEGDAQAVSPNIILTKSLNDLDSDGSGSVGRATYFKPIQIWDKATDNLADFTTSFSFAISSLGNTTRGSGFAFFLANSDSDLQPSSEYGYLGLMSETDVQCHFVAVEFDTATSDWDPTDMGEHIGIDVNSMISKNLTEWYNDIENGGLIQAWIEYNSRSKELSVNVTNGYYLEYARNDSYYLHYSVDFRNSTSEWVTLGFSASTSKDYFEEHLIYSWDFNSTLQLGASSSIFSAKRKNRISWLWPILGTVGALVLVSAVLGMVCLAYRRNKRRQQRPASSPKDEFGNGNRNGNGNETRPSQLREGSIPVVSFTQDEFEKETGQESRDGSNINIPASFTKEEFENETGPRSFSYEELVTATNNFADDRIIGKGGFGIVYVGFFNNNSLSVAVKRITSDSERGLKAYASEVKAISRLRHRNLVQLLGWCRKNQQLLIVYAFMQNKSLDFHLFNKTGLLTWERRYGIALGLASGLLYLHEECEQCVLHRDIKSSNVLLDSNFNAKLGDFGLARLVEHGQDSETTGLIGTVGYVAPEYLQSRKATKETDVYSFGIVALEIATGKPAFKEIDGDHGTKLKVKLVDWIWEQYRKGNIFSVADPLLNQNYSKEEMKRLVVVGLACAHPSQYHRLSIRDAIDVLNAKASLPILAFEMPSYQGNIYSPLTGSSVTGSNVSYQTSTSATSHST